VQSAVSEQIRRLEQEVGVQLFVRSSRKVALTEAGKALVPEVRAGLDQLDRIRSIAERFKRGEQGQVLVGFNCMTGAEFASRLVRLFENDHPAVQVTLRELPSMGIAPLLNGTIDVAVGWLPSAGNSPLSSVVLADEPVVAVLPEHGALAGRSVVTTEQIAESERVSWPGFQDCTADLSLRSVSPLAPHHQLRNWPVETVTEMLTAVAAGRGIALAAESVARIHPWPGVIFRPVLGIPARELVLTWLSDTTNEAARGFVGLATAVANRRHHADLGAAT
jgi:DNA-binding transcriptional LysR family regulator